VSNSTGPIADLSYRTYDGTLDAPTQRWKVIARTQIMRVVKLKGYWWCLAIGGWYYLIMLIGLFILDALIAGTGQGAADALERLQLLDWKAQFLHGYSFGQLFYMFIALIAGAGAIANDNRANALLVYLSKPCTKKDYVIGKWVGVFVPVYFAMALPFVVFYAYGAMNYREFGFISDDPWLFVRMIFIMAFGAAFHASLVLGVSSMFNQGRMAGATYVGAYFITSMITVFLGVILDESDSGRSSLASLAEALYYCSIDGLNIGVAKILLDLDYAPLFISNDTGFTVDRPAPWLAFGLVFALSALALRLVWRRVRAVEVVG
jgi:ABC-2 type transport system permease protein